MDQFEKKLGNGLEIEEIESISEKSLETEDTYKYLIPRANLLFSVFGAERHYTERIETFCFVFCFFNSLTNQINEFVSFYLEIKK